MLIHQGKKRKRDENDSAMQGVEKGSAPAIPKGITIRKINNEVIKPAKVPDEPKNYPAKHISPSTRYPNIFLLGKKKSGKTSAIRHMLPKFCNKKTKIIAFVPTIYKDPRWLELCEWADENKIEMVKKTDNEPDKETGTRFLDDMVDMLKKKKTQSLSEMVEDMKRNEEKDNYVVICDDMSSATRAASLSTLLKRNRHFGIVTMIGKHRHKDTMPEAHPQADIICIWRGFSLKSLLDIHEDHDLDMPADLFVKLHRCITKNPEEHAFMYVDCLTGEVRKNFNIAIDIPATQGLEIKGLNDAILAREIKKHKKQKLS